MVLAVNWLFSTKHGALIRWRDNRIPHSEQCLKEGKTSTQLKNLQQCPRGFSWWNFEQWSKSERICRQTLHACELLCCNSQCELWHDKHHHHDLTSVKMLLTFDAFFIFSNVPNAACCSFAAFHLVNQLHIQQWSKVWNFIHIVHQSPRPGRKTTLLGTSHFPVWHHPAAKVNILSLDDVQPCFTAGVVVIWFFKMQIDHMMKSGERRETHQQQQCGCKLDSNTALVFNSSLKSSCIISITH